MGFFFNFHKNLSGIASECQRVWIQIRLNILLGLTWVQTVCRSISRRQKSPQSEKELNSLTLYIGYSNESGETLKVQSTLNLCQ